MVVENQKVITATYDLYIAGEEGKEELMEQMTARTPLVWCQGEGMMLPAFEAQMEGKNVGDTFDFVIKSDDAYGPYYQEGLMDLPRTMFFNGNGEFDEEHVFVGAVVPMNTVDGQIVKAQVCEITKDHVTIDLNHPYAGEDLHFKGEILDIRDASDKELEAIRNPHRCGKCHGNCGDCESDCGGCEK